MLDTTLASIQTESMQQATFNYPPAFTTLPDYTAHAGQTVTVIRQLTADDGVSQNGEVETMFLVRASDGWEGHAFESELEDMW